MKQSSGIEVKGLFFCKLAEGNGCILIALCAIPFPPHILARYKNLYQSFLKRPPKGEAYSFM